MTSAGGVETLEKRRSTCGNCPSGRGQVDGERVRMEIERQKSRDQRRREGDQFGLTSGTEEIWKRFPRRRSVRTRAEPSGRVPHGTTATITHRGSTAGESRRVSVRKGGLFGNVPSLIGPIASTCRFVQCSLLARLLRLRQYMDNASEGSQKIRE